MAKEKNTKGNINFFSHFNKILPIYPEDFVDIKVALIYIPQQGIIIPSQQTFQSEVDSKERNTK